jgi:uncharacterized membrane protein
MEQCMAEQRPPMRDQPDGLAPVLDRNIRELELRRRAKQGGQSLQDRIAEAVSGFAGSMTFVSIHMLLFGAWIVVNLGWAPVRPFDPTFVVLGMVASVEAIFLSTFVLITQNRMAAQADRRADLDLHIGLLAEHEVTRLVNLVAAIAERMGIDEARAPEIAELARDVAPEAVLDRIEREQAGG